MGGGFSSPTLETKGGIGDGEFMQVGRTYRYNSLFVLV